MKKTAILLAALAALSAAGSPPLRGALPPAESLVAGFTAVPAWNTSVGRNFNMASDEFKDATMKTVLSKQDWVHSFFIQAPYSVAHKLYEDLVQKTK